MKRIPLLAALTAVLFACDAEDPITPASTAPTAPQPAIIDAAHSDDVENFYFLPPMVKQPGFDGVFNPALSPTVEICELESVSDGSGGTTQQCEASPRTGFPLEFTLSSGPDGETIRVSTTDEHYQLNWHTKDFDINTEKTYRIRILAGSTLLGYADVRLADNGRDLKNLNSGENVALKDGRTLPIKFRVEEGALCENDTDCFEGTVGPDGGTFTTPSDFAGVRFPADAVDEDVNLIIERKDPGEQPGGECLPTSLEQFEGCYLFDTTPKVDQFNVDVTVGVCRDPAAQPEDQFLLHKFDPDKPDDGVVALENVFVDFLDCADFGPIASGPAESLLARAADGMRTVVEPVVHLFGPTPLWAGDRGLGGLVGSFSRIGWARPLTVSAFAGDGQSAPAGSEVEINPAVRVTATHYDGHDDDVSAPPIEGVEVTFTVASPVGGHVRLPDDGAETAAPSVTATTDANGVASVTWTLGVEAGGNALDVSVGPPSNEVSMSAEGLPLATTTTLQTVVPLAIINDPVTLTASVVPAPRAAEAPVVEFFTGETSLGTAAVENGLATLPADLSLREHSVRAEFAGTKTHIASTSGAATMHTIQRFDDSDSFHSVLSERGAGLTTEDFSSFDDGTLIETIFAGTLSVTSPFEILEVFDTEKSLFGHDETTRFDGTGRYDLIFSDIATSNALAFDVIAQDPNSDPATIETETQVGVASFLLANEGAETDPNFFGVIASLRLASVAVIEGFEQGGTIKEEISLDNFIISDVPGMVAPGGVASVEVTPETTVVDLFDSVQLEAILRDASGAVVDGPAITWTSSDPDIATVDSNGLVQASGTTGTVGISATADGVTGTATVSVQILVS